MKEYLIECIDRTFDDEDYYKINKYIEDLEERIDMAIFFLKETWTESSDIYNHFSAGCGCGNNFEFEDDRKELLEILNKEVE